MLPTFCPPMIWTIAPEFYWEPSILAADDLLKACYRKAMTPQKLWTLLFLHPLQRRHRESLKVLAGLAFFEMLSGYPRSAFQELCGGHPRGSAAVCDPNPSASISFARYRIKMTGVSETSLLNFVVFARFLALIAKVWQVSDRRKRQELTMSLFA